MVLKDNLIITKESVLKNLKRITNQIYKLLPNREENIDWEIPLKTIIIELSGMNIIFEEIGEEYMFSLLCKLQGLFQLKEEEDFFDYRRTIFDCLNIISTLKEEIEKCQD